MNQKFDEMDKKIEAKSDLPPELISKLHANYLKTLEQNRRAQDRYKQKKKLAEANQINLQEKYKKLKVTVKTLSEELEAIKEEQLKDQEVIKELVEVINGYPGMKYTQLR
jgi:uncharacterized protein YlxW (UPF0749 family)